MPCPAADRGLTALHTLARGCAAVGSGAAVRSGATGGRGPETKEDLGGRTGGRGPWEDSGRALRPERPGPGDRPEGDARRALEM